MKCIVAGKTLVDEESRKKYDELFDAIYIEDSGHIMMFEDPDNFNKVLISRIQELID